MKNRWIIFIGIVLLFISCQTSARSTYNLETRELFIPIVYVDGVSYEATLSLLEGDKKLILSNTQISHHSSDQPASYSNNTGIATIPYVELLGSNTAYAATLTLVSTTSSIAFELTSLEEIPVLPITSGAGTFLRVGFNHQYLATGSDDRMHLTFAEGVDERIFYGSCQTSCVSDAAWNPVQLLSSADLGVITSSPLGISVDSTGRVHLLVSSVTNPGGSTNTLLYGTCATACSAPSNWTWLDLFPMGIDTSFTSGSLMVEPSGRVSIIIGNEKVVYLACSGTCTSLENWNFSITLNVTPLQAMVDSVGVTHVMVYNFSPKRMLGYARCASNCEITSNWEISSLGFSLNGEVSVSSASLTVTSSGRVFMAFKGEDRKLSIASCVGSGCLDLTTWTGFTTGELDEGESSAWLETRADESVVLVSDTTSDLRLRSCYKDCHLATSWSTAAVIDSDAAISLVIPPDSGSACQGFSESAGWHPRRGRVGFGQNGMVVVHNPYALVKCPGIISILPTPSIGRVISTF